METLSLELLPTELVYEIINFFDVKTVVEAIIDDTTVWNLMCIRDFKVSGTKDVYKSMYKYSKLFPVICEIIEMSCDVDEGVAKRMAKDLFPSGRYYQIENFHPKKKFNSISSFVVNKIHSLLVEKQTLTDFVQKYI